MNANLKKIVTLALAGALAVSSFVACQAPAEETSSTPDAESSEAGDTSEPEDESSEEVSADPVTLQLFMPANATTQSDIDDVHVAFNEEVQKIYPYMTVEIRNFLISEYKTSFDNEMAANSTIDVAWKGYMMDTATYAADETFEDLNTLLSQDALDVVPQFLRDVATVDGQLQYLPKVEMHHWVEGMYTSHAAYENYFPVADYDAAMEDYFANATTAANTEAMYDVYETYMAAAEAGGDLGSGFSPYVSSNWKGLTLVGTSQAFPATILKPAAQGGEWDTTVVNLYEQESTVEWFKKLAEWKEKGWMRNDLIDLADKMRQYENTNENGNLIWFHNYVNPADPECDDVFEDQVRAGWAENYTVVPFSASLVASGSADGIAIPYTTSNATEAAKLLELFYTETGRAAKNTLVFGIEDVHYTADATNELRVERITGSGGLQESDAYGAAAWIYGNTLTTYLEPTQADNQYEYYGEATDFADKSPILGFNFDLTDHTTIISAIDADVLSVYIPQFLAGLYTDELYAEMMTKLDGLGIDAIIADLNAQIDAAGL